MAIGILAEPISNKEATTNRETPALYVMDPESRGMEAAQEHSLSIIVFYGVGLFPAEDVFRLVIMKNVTKNIQRIKS